MRRLAALGLLVLGVAACGGSDAAGPGAPVSKPAASAQTAVVAGQPTPAQLEFREQLLEQLRNGTYGDCDCNGDERARERIENGLVDPPPADSTVSEEAAP